MAKKRTSTRKAKSQSAPGDDTEVAEIERVLRVFREATGLEVCIKLLSSVKRALTGLEAVAARHNLHRSAFCTEVKRSRNERCKECDLRDVPARCLREREIFSHVCHAGAGELIVPLFLDDALAGVVFVGQFRSGEGQPRELPLMTEEKRELMEGLARMLAAYLGERLRAPRFVSESSRGYRAEAIRRFLEKNLRGNPSLTELAGHLGLSATRTAHAVREATGSSFVELRDTLRMERAKGLLGGTYHKIGYVSAECGFSTPQYFHRFFRKQAGTTPLAFRRKQRVNA